MRQMKDLYIWYLVLNNLEGPLRILDLRIHHSRRYIPKPPEPPGSRHLSRCESLSAPPPPTDGHGGAVAASPDLALATLA